MFYSLSSVGQTWIAHRNPRISNCHWASSCNEKSLVRSRSVSYFLQKKTNDRSSPYAGDIRILQAVDIPELNCLQDVLVFSSQGDRMFPRRHHFFRIIVFL